MEKIATMAKILSDINRVKILGLLIENKELCVCEICDTLQLSQPLVSRHLKQIREAGIISSKQRGKWMIYSLEINHDLDFRCWFNELKKTTPFLPNLVVCDRKNSAQTVAV